jgi:hypothetical protein
MSDEQFHTLFAAMERHLDKRADAIEHGVAAAEQRLEARFDAKIEALETKLLSELTYLPLYEQLYRNAEVDGKPFC